MSESSEETPVAGEQISAPKKPVRKRAPAKKRVAAATQPELSEAAGAAAKDGQQQAAQAPAAEAPAAPPNVMHADHPVTPHAESAPPIEIHSATAAPVPVAVVEPVAPEPVREPAAAEASVDGGASADGANAASQIPEAARYAGEQRPAGEQHSSGAQRPSGEQRPYSERPPYQPRPERHDRHDRQDRRPEYPPRFDRNEAPRPERNEPVEIQYGEGIVEVSGKGFGFLRDAKRSFNQSPLDIFVTPEAVRRFFLRDGMWLRGEIRRGGRGPQLHRITEVDGGDPEQCRNLPNFEELTTINPNRRIRLETVPERFTTRIIDMMTPVGKGQRGLIVAPPRTGKTTLLQHIADAVVKNHPEMKLIILLVDERPEEVTEIRRTVPQAEIMASSNDSDLKSHTRIAQLAIERAKRLVEASKDVFILLDSLTRVGRAFNNAMTGSGRTLSGGMDARAMEIPRKLFAAARNTEEAGSLTIMATALIETGSRMDDLIFQEFKGTGNMELVLDRKISDQRIYPAIDIFLSGTRREELLLPQHELEKINVIRRGLAGHKPVEAIERLLSFVKKFPTNAQMLKEIPG